MCVRNNQHFLFIYESVLQIQEVITLYSIILDMMKWHLSSTIRFLQDDCRNDSIHEILGIFEIEGDIYVKNTLAFDSQKENTFVVS